MDEHDRFPGRPADAGSTPGAPSGPRLPPPRVARRRGGGGLRWIVRLLLGLFFTALAGFALLVVASWLLVGPPITVEDGTWIEVRFSPEYPEERQSPHGWGAVLEPRMLSAQELHAALRRAEADPRVTGIVLHADGFAGGWAQAHELRTRLRGLREQGKRVVAFAAAPSSVDFYLASAAERVQLAPEGLLWIGGLQAQLVFLRDTLDKVGIAVESVAVGEYKSAPETFTEDGSSEANRRQIGEYLDDVFDVFTQQVADGRGLTLERVRTLVDRGLYDPVEALGEGLVDAIGDLDVLLDGLEPVLLLDPIEYLGAAGQEPGRGHVPHVALVHVSGTIAYGRNGEDGLSGTIAGHETVIERLQQAADDDAVRAIVLRVDSPGGSVLASDLILQEVRRARERKPLVVSMSETAASGGYYVSMEADEIWADPLTLTGSIGVFLLRPDLSGAYEKLGLRVENYRRGENAHLFDTTRGLEPGQRALLQEQLDRFYVRFVERVADGRGIAVAAAEEAARGRVWTAQRALDAGLVDALGGEDDAIAAAARLGGIDEKVRPRIVTYQPEPTMLDRALQGLFADDVILGGSVSRNATVRSLALEPLRLLESFAPALDGTPQFLLPWRLRVR